MTIILCVFLHNQPYENIIKRAKEINQRDQLKADKLHNAVNDSYPATSADTSESSPYNIKRSVNDFDDDDDEDDAAGDRIDSDNENGHNVDEETAAKETSGQRQQQDGGNGALTDQSTTEQTNNLNGETTPKSPKSQSDVKDDDDMVQECKKHKENDFAEDH